MKKTVILLLIISLIYIFITACNQNHSSEISIAEQYGLAYAPIQIMKEKKILEENLNNVEINWKQMINTTTIREAMLAGKLDLGFMAIPPFLIGKDQGMEWKIISGLSMSPLGLTTYKSDIKNITDINEKDRIALPQPGSIQHILLAMAAEKDFDDATRFDDILVTMSHPDGMNALLSRQEITAHFTSPPYLFKEVEEEGIDQILSSDKAFGGEFTFIVGVTTESFYNEKPEIYEAVVKSLEQALDFINNNPEETAAILAKKFDLSQDETLKYITWPGMKYSSTIKGLDTFYNFMKVNQYIEFDYDKITELVREEDYYEK